LCPALDSLICTICCGEKRKKTVKCPPNCQYLKKSKEYLQKRKLLAEEEYVRERFPTYFQKLEGKIIEMRKTRLFNLTDYEVKEALEQSLANLKIKKKKIIYEYKSPNPNVQLVAEAISEIITSYMGKNNAFYLDLDNAIFLIRKEIEFCQRLIEERRGDTHYLDIINTLGSSHLDERKEK